MFHQSFEPPKSLLYGCDLSYLCSTLYCLTPSLGCNFGSEGFCFLFTFRKFLATARSGIFFIQTFPQSTITLMNSINYIN